MARDRFKEQVVREEADELIVRLGFMLALSHAERQARKAVIPDEQEAWAMIARRIRRLGQGVDDEEQEGGDNAGNA